MIEVEFVEVHADNKIAQGFRLKTGQVRIHKVSETHSWTHSLKTSPQHTLKFSWTISHFIKDEKKTKSVQQHYHLTSS